MIIQAVLVLGFLLITYWFLSNRTSSKVRAWQKIGLLSLFILATLAVIFPNLLNDIANAVGVGRGADLVLYIFVFAFMAYVTIQYIKQKEHDRVTATLVRRIAIIEANEKAAETQLKRISKQK
jgi:small membrane protein